MSLPTTTTDHKPETMPLPKYSWRNRRTPNRAAASIPAVQIVGAPNELSASSVSIRMTIPHELLAFTSPPPLAHLLLLQGRLTADGRTKKVKGDGIHQQMAKIPEAQNKGGR